MGKVKYKFVIHTIILSMIVIMTTACSKDEEVEVFDNELEVKIEDEIFPDNAEIEIITDEEDIEDNSGEENEYIENDITQDVDLIELFDNNSNTIFTLGDDIPFGLSKFDVSVQDIINYYGEEYEINKSSFLYPDEIEQLYCIMYPDFESHNVKGYLSFFFDDDRLVAVGIIKDYNSPRPDGWGGDTDLLSLIEDISGTEYQGKLSNGTGEIYVRFDGLKYCCNKTTRRFSISFVAIKQ